MKYILLSLLISSTALANSIPISEAQKAINLEPNAGAVTCAQKPDEQCLDFTGIDWESAELKEIMRPIKTCTTTETENVDGEIEQVETCEVTGHEPTGLFELKENQAKKQAKEAKQKAEADALKQKEQERDSARKEIEALEKKQTWTTAELTKAVKLLLAK